MYHWKMFQKQFGSKLQVKRHRHTTDAKMTTKATKSAHIKRKTGRRTTLIQVLDNEGINS